MLALKVNDTFLDLEGTTINLELSSPLFSFEAAEGILSYPFTIPLTATNKKALGHVDVLNVLVEASNYTFDAEIHLFGNPYLQGTVDILTIDSSIQLNFNGISSHFYSSIRGKMMHEYNLGSVTSDTPNGPQTFLEYAKKACQEGHSSHNVSFYEVYNPSFQSGGMPKLNSCVNLWVKENGVSGFKKNIATEITDDGTYSYTVPFPYVFSALKKALLSEGWILTGGISDIEELKSLTFFHQKSANKRYSELIFTPNAVIGSINEPRFPLQVNEFVPEVTIADIIFNVNKTFCTFLKINVIDKTVSFEPLKSQLDSINHIDISDFVGPFRISLSPLAHDRWKYELVSEYTQDEISDITEIEYLYSPTPNYDVAEKPTNEFNTNIKVPQSSFNKVLSPSQTYYATRLSPTVKVAGFSKSINSNNKIDDVAFCFFRGMHEGLHDDVNTGQELVEYPMGSFDTKDVFNSEIAQYSLDWLGDKGLYEMWWKRWIDFLSKTKSVNTSLMWTANDLLTADLTQKYYANGHLFFIKKLKVKLSTSAIESIDAEMLKI